MAQVFLSYQRLDRDLAQRIGDALIRAGLTIWWDDDINPRENWDREIEREIDKAEFVLVLWTKNSVDSDWVRLEAHRAKQFQPSKLIQARFDDCTLPIAYLLTQYLDLDRERVQEGATWPKLLRWLDAPDRPDVDSSRSVEGSGNRFMPTGAPPRRGNGLRDRDANEQYYAAFLSFSYRDVAAARRLCRRLESYRLPRHLVGKETQHGRVRERLSPVFLDREELPSSNDLNDTVRVALADSGSLLILCSPHSAHSLWVEEEIRAFHSLYPTRPILAAVIDGDPEDCLPPVLLAIAQNGLGQTLLATDLRPQGAGLHLGMLQLVAGITGVSLDQLVQRDAARRIRRVLAVTVGAVIAMLIMAALTLAALSARREAERLRGEAERRIGLLPSDLREQPPQRRPPAKIR